MVDGLYSVWSSLIRTLQKIITDPVDGIMQILWRRSRNTTKHCDKAETPSSPKASIGEHFHNS